MQSLRKLVSISHVTHVAKTIEHTAAIKLDFTPGLGLTRCRAVCKTIADDGHPCLRNPSGKLYFHNPNDGVNERGTAMAGWSARDQSICDGKGLERIADPARLRTVVELVPAELESDLSLTR